MANALPTSAAAMTRGSRAMKKICASMLSAYGCELSKTFRRLMLVPPASGASRHAASARIPNPASVHARRLRTVDPRWAPGRDSVLSGKRHYREMPGARVKLDIGVHFVERADV